MKRLFLLSLITISFKVFSSDCYKHALLEMDGLITEAEQEAQAKATILVSHHRPTHANRLNNKRFSKKRQAARDDKDFRLGLWTTPAIETAYLQRIKEAKQ